MTWSVRRFATAVGVVVVLALPSLGAAAPPVASPELGPPVRTIAGLTGRRLAIDTPRALDVRPHAQISHTLYLERCPGGCSLRQGANDAQAGSSMLLLIPDATVREFASRQGATGPAADEEWEAIVRCVTEVYSPYDVVVTDVRPATDRSFHEAIIAGQPEDVGRSSDVLGVAPLADDCRAIDNVISLTFANAHASRSVADRVLNICWTAAQESAHAFGLEHEYSFVAGNRSACSDPMTYRNDCGGQKFFRDEAATCGESVARDCRCAKSQNSHAKLLSVFGPGTPITRKPTVTLVSPAAGSEALGSAIVATAGAQRGVARVELFINGNKWATASGAPVLRDGQPDPSTYSIPVPPDLPNSIVDIKTVALDDLGEATESEVVTLTNGAPCASAETCATGQRCEDGRCFWDPPAGELGEACSYSQLCKSELCEGAAGQQICTQRCTAGAADACPDGFACVRASATTAVCLVAVDAGGCCRVDRGDPGWAHFGIGAVVLAFAIRKRRR